MKMDSISKLAKEIEMIVTKAKYYQRYYDFRKNENGNIHLSNFLNQVVKKDTEKLKKLEQELSAGQEQSNTNLTEKNNLDINRLNDLIQKALAIYHKLLFESQLLEVN